MIGERGLIIAACSALVGCLGSGLVEGDLQQTQLDVSRGRWRDAGIVNYRYDVEQLCACPGVRTATVEVQGSAVVAVTVLSSGEAVDPSSFGLYPTVEKLFDTIQRAMEQDPDILNVEYDPVLGYPQIIQIDMVIGNSEDDVQIRTSEFVADP